jgi:transcriptional regulator with XRE-family HTH domain
MRLIEARLRNGLKQFDLQKLSGIHQSRISFIERGEIDPRIDEQDRLERALGLKVDWHRTKTLGKKPILVF